MRRSWSLLIACAFVFSLLFLLHRAEGDTRHLDNGTPGQVDALAVESASLDLLMEAENADLSSPMEVGADGNASGGAYISATSGGSTDSPEQEASYDFSVSEDGDYYLWARIYGPDEDSDAIYIGIDGSWARTYPDSTGEYRWTRVATSRSDSDEYEFSLDEGEHEIQVGHAELNTRLDALYLTDDPDSSPPDADTEPPSYSPTQPSEAFELTLEAESGSVGSPFTMDSDSNASGGWYISATSGDNASSAEQEASYTFSVPHDGTYWLWARLYALNDDSDAIYIGIDGSWDRVYPAEQDEYVWTRVGPERDSTGKYGVSLEGGSHEVQVGHAELHSRLDALFITDDWDAHPDEPDTSLDFPSDPVAPTPTPAPSTPTPVSYEGHEIYLEAEDGSLTSDMEIGRDVSSSGGAYISATDGSNTESPEREASYEFSVPEEGNYYLWARLYGSNEDSDAIYIGIDGSWARTYPDTTGEYHWTRVAISRNDSEYEFSLDGGSHEIQVGHAELFARLDTLFITDNPNAQPEEPEEPPEQPSPIPTATSFPTATSTPVPESTPTPSATVTPTVTLTPSPTPSPSYQPTYKWYLLINDGGETSSYGPYETFDEADQARSEFLSIAESSFSGSISSVYDGHPDFQMPPPQYLPVRSYTDLIALAEQYAAGEPEDTSTPTATLTPTATPTVNPVPTATPTPPSGGGPQLPVPIQPVGQPTDDYYLFVEFTFPEFALRSFGPYQSEDDAKAAWVDFLSRNPGDYTRNVWLAQKVPAAPYAPALPPDVLASLDLYDGDPIPEPGVPSPAPGNEELQIISPTDGETFYVRAGELFEHQIQITGTAGKEDIAYYKDNPKRPPGIEPVPSNDYSIDDATGRITWTPGEEHANQKYMARFFVDYSYSGGGGGRVYRNFFIEVLPAESTDPIPIPTPTPTQTPMPGPTLTPSPTVTPTPSSTPGRGAPTPTTPQECATYYTVQLGDTLSAIAIHFYQDASRWPEIYEANRNVIGDDPNVIKQGQVLCIPGPIQEPEPPDEEEESEDRKVIFIQGIDSESGPIQESCDDQDVGFIDASGKNVVGWMVEYLTGSTWVNEAIPSLDSPKDFFYFSYSGLYCSDLQKPIYSEGDSCEGVQHAADKLKGLTETLVSRYPSARFDVVAHSMGGLVAAQWLWANPGMQSRVNSVITFDSPLRGIPFKKGFPLDACNHFSSFSWNDIWCKDYSQIPEECASVIVPTIGNLGSKVPFFTIDATQQEWVVDEFLPGPGLPVFVEAVSGDRTTLLDSESQLHCQFDDDHASVWGRAETHGIVECWLNYRRPVGGEQNRPINFEIRNPSDKLKAIFVACSITKPRNPKDCRGRLEIGQ